MWSEPCSAAINRRLSVSSAQVMSTSPLKSIEKKDTKPVVAKKRPHSDPVQDAPPAKSSSAWESLDGVQGDLERISEQLSGLSESLLELNLKITKIRSCSTARSGPKPTVTEVSRRDFLDNLMVCYELIIDFFLIVFTMFGSL